MNLSAHFTRDEFACKCGKCGFDTVDTELLTLLEIIRNHFDSPVHITSGARCAEWNAKQGGYPTSQHLVGKAADIVVENYTPQQVQDFVEKHTPMRGGLGRYADFTHVDVRDSRARW